MIYTFEGSQVEGMTITPLIQEYWRLKKMEEQKLKKDDMPDGCLYTPEDYHQDCCVHCTELGNCVYTRILNEENL
jgi:hypothetical protein